MLVAAGSTLLQPWRCPNRYYKGLRIRCLYPVAGCLSAFHSPGRSCSHGTLATDVGAICVAMNLQVVNPLPQQPLSSKDVRDVLSPELPVLHAVGVQPVHGVWILLAPCLHSTPLWWSATCLLCALQPHIGEACQDSKPANNHSVNEWWVTCDQVT
jgi:hypothetical protein